MVASTHKSSRWERTLFGALLLVHLVPIWALPYFITQDGPAHVYNAFVFRQEISNQSSLAAYYTLNVRLLPNWCTTILLGGLMQLMSIPAAEKALVSLFVLGLPLAIRYTLVAISRDAAWLSWLVFPVIYNDLLHRGFYNFLLGVVVSFVILGYWLRYRERPRPQQVVVIAALALVLYFCHIIALFSVVLMLLILTACFEIQARRREPMRVNTHDRPVNRAWVNSWWGVGLVPALTLAAIFVATQPGEQLSASYAPVILIWWAYGITAVANTPFYLLPSIAITLLWMGLAVYVLLHMSDDATWYLEGFLLCAVSLFVLYFGLPETIGSGSFLNQRLLIFTLLVAILFLARGRFSRRAKFFVQAAASTVAIMLVVQNVQIGRLLNQWVAEYMTASTAIRPGGTFVSVCAASEGCGVAGRRGYLRLASLSHVWGYLATTENMIGLSNFHAHSMLFPVKYVARLDPMPFQGVQSRDGRRTWFPDLPTYSERTGGTIDYIVLWGISDAASRGDDVEGLMDWLNRDYDLSFVSSSRRLSLYQRKDLSLSWPADQTLRHLLNTTLSPSERRIPTKAVEHPE